MPHASSRHRAATHRAERSPRRIPSRRALAAAAVGGVLLTGGAVGAQAVVGGSSDRAAAGSGEPALAANPSDAAGVSRSSDRPVLTAIDDATAKAADQAMKVAKDEAADETKRKKKAEAKAKAKAAAEAAIEDARNDPQGAAQAMLADYGWNASQFSCLDSLWSGESGWNYQATNPSSGAYGIPQSLPATKMATAGADWKTNPVTQIRWGLTYIRDAYGSPCEAQGFKSGNGFY